MKNRLRKICFVFFAVALLESPNIWARSAHVQVVSGNDLIEILEPNVQVKIDTSYSPPLESVHVKGILYKKGWNILDSEMNLLRLIPSSVPEYANQFEVDFDLEKTVTKKTLTAISVDGNTQEVSVQITVEGGSRAEPVKTEQSHSHFLKSVGLSFPCGYFSTTNLFGGKTHLRQVGQLYKATLDLGFYRATNAQAKAWEFSLRSEVGYQLPSYVTFPLWYSGRIEVLIRNLIALNPSRGNSLGPLIGFEYESFPLLSSYVISSVAVAPTLAWEVRNMGMAWITLGARTHWGGKQGFEITPRFSYGAGTARLSTSGGVYSHSGWKTSLTGITPLFRRLRVGVELLYSQIGGAAEVVTATASGLIAYPL